MTAGQRLAAESAKCEETNGFVLFAFFAAGSQRGVPN